MSAINNETHQQMNKVCVLVRWVAPTYSRELVDGWNTINRHMHSKYIKKLSQQKLSKDNEKNYLI